MEIEGGIFHFAKPFWNRIDEFEIKSPRLLKRNNSAGPLKVLGREKVVLTYAGFGKALTILFPLCDNTGNK